MAKKDAELRNKDEQIHETEKDYKNLLEIKITLDTEIAAYNKMLEGEESRLGMSQTSSPDLGAEGRGIKRKRTIVEEEDLTETISDHTGLGNIQIEPLPKDGKSITLTNKSDKEVAIGGWFLSNDSGEHRSSYKFHASIKLAPLNTCTIWSADTQEEHSPPTTLVMKKGGWTVGSHNRTVLVNKDGNEEAVRLSREERRQVTISDFKKFEEQYRFSNEEEDDLKKAYCNGEGDMNFILDNVLCCTVEDDERFAEKLKEWIKDEVVPEFAAFKKSNTKAAKAKRRANLSKEAEEAEQHAADLGLNGATDSGEDALRMMIAKRQEKR